MPKYGCMLIGGKFRHFGKNNSLVTIMTTDNIGGSAAIWTLLVIIKPLIDNIPVDYDIIFYKNI